MTMQVFCEPCSVNRGLNVRPVKWKTVISTIILSCKISYNKKVCIIELHLHQIIFSFFELSFINLKQLYSQFKGRQ